MPCSLANSQDEASQLVCLKQHLEQNTVPQGFPLGLRKCFLKDGLIYRQFTDTVTQTQVVVPASLKNTILQEMHNQLGHFGIKKTFEYVKT